MAKTRHRAHGEGAIFKQKKNGRLTGKWVAQITISDGGIRRRRKTTICSTEQDAVAKVREMQGDQGKDLAPADERITVAAWLERWLRDYAQPPALRPRTFAGYRTICREITNVLGRRRLRELTTADVKRYLRLKREAGLSPRSLQYHRAVLRSALSDAARVEPHALVDRNVARSVKLEAVTRPMIQPLTPEQARTFLEGIRGDRDEALLVIALASGMRQGEVLALRWEDVDFDAATVSVNASLQRYAGAYHRDSPKTERSVRAVSLPPALLEVLRSHKSRQREEQLRAGPSWRACEWDLVFRTETGEPLSGNQVTRRFQAHLRRLGLPKQRFHDLRHAAASFLIAQGVDLRTIMDILGHSTITTTANTYAHVLRDAHRDAAHRMGDLLLGERRHA